MGKQRNYVTSKLQEEKQWNKESVINPTKKIKKHRKRMINRKDRNYWSINNHNKCKQNNSYLPKHRLLDWKKFLAVLFTEELTKQSYWKSYTRQWVTKGKLM